MYKLQREWLFLIPLYDFISLNYKDIYICKDCKYYASKDDFIELINKFDK